jgi:hypothetical protein
MSAFDGPLTNERLKLVERVAYDVLHVGSLVSAVIRSAGFRRCPGVVRQPEEQLIGVQVPNHKGRSSQSTRSVRMPFSEGVCATARLDRPRGR